MKREVDDSVRAALRRVWPDPATVEKTEIRALGGGVNPRTFLAVTGKQRYVLRLPHSRSVALLDLETEARAMRAAAAADLAPAVIAVDIDAGLLLTEYRAMPWTHELVRQPIAISVIVRLLRALHALPVDLPVYAVESIARRYLAALDSLQSPMSAEERVWADELLRVARGFEASHAPTAFCHTDLVASNILIDGAAARLIDFEYAGRGPAARSREPGGAERIHGGAATAAALRVLRKVGRGADGARVRRRDSHAATARVFLGACRHAADPRNGRVRAARSGTWCNVEVGQRWRT